jgi:hypothetical protein
LFCDSENRTSLSWTLDFQFDTTVDRRTLKLLNIVEGSPVNVRDRRPVPIQRRRQRV